jgi:hypothetical protein
MGCKNQKENLDIARKSDYQKLCPVGLTLQTPLDIKGFPDFPEGTKSFLKKHLNREVWT